MIAWDGIERRRFVRVKLHCTASLTDEEGWSTFKGISIKIVRR